jgi:hypothetical protein
MNSVHTIQPYFRKILFNIILPSTFRPSEWFYPVRFSTNFVRIYKIPYACYLRRSFRFCAFIIVIIPGITDEEEYKLQTFSLYSFLQQPTERRGPAINTPPLYSGYPGFKSRFGDRLSWLCFWWFSPVPPGKLWDSILNSATSTSTSFPNHHLSIILSTLYSLSYWESVVK